MTRKSNARMIQIGLAGIVLLLGAAFALYQRQQIRRTEAATAAAWMVAGPACLPPAPGVAPPPLPKQMAFEDVAIARQLGGTSACNTVRENGNGDRLTICQFFNPGWLKITTAKGTYTFAPDPGRDASLIVRNGAPSCVQHVNPALLQ